MPSVDDNPRKYFLESYRKESFKSWPFTERQKCSITKMAEAGFYWCGTMQENDAAACFLCEKQLDGWESSDDPWVEHRKHAPQCEFVKLGKPEKQITVAEQLDLMMVYVEKVFDRKLEKSMETLTRLANKARESIQQTT